MLDNDRYITAELISEAHEIIEKHRPRLLEAAPKGAKYHLDKLLEGLLNYAPTPTGARCVAVTLHVAATKDTSGQFIVEAARAWLDQLLAIGGVNRSESSGRQTPILDETARNIEPADRTEQKEFRAALAERENYHCAITGTFDRARYDFLEAEQRSQEVHFGLGVHTMVAAHIIPPFLVDHGGGRNGLKDPARTWDILQSWTQIHQPVGLKITSLRNAIFMTSEDHLQFGTFKFYLEKATYPHEPNKYLAKCLHTRLSNGQLDSTVTFNDSDPPEPQYLKIHAAFAKVLDLSGAADHLVDLRRDADRM